MNQNFSFKQMVQDYVATEIAQYNVSKEQFNQYVQQALVYNKEDK